MKREWERRGGRGGRERSEGIGREMGGEGGGGENSFCDTSNGYKLTVLYRDTCSLSSGEPSSNTGRFFGLPPVASRHLSYVSSLPSSRVILLSEGSSPTT